MIAYQTLVAPDGYEVALFPMPYMNMSQDEGGDYSHTGTYNIDFLGWGENGRILNAPIYAPCTMKVVDVKLTFEWGNTVVFESVNPVHLPNGNLAILTFSVAHDNNPPITVLGATVNQGQLCYHTGTYGNVTGDHVHSCLGEGTYQGYTQRASGNYDLTNRIHYWDGVFVNGTTIIQGYGHNWIEYIAPISTTKRKPSFKKFPWVLYANKLRNNY